MMRWRDAERQGTEAGFDGTFRLRLVPAVPRHGLRRSSPGAMDDKSDTEIRRKTQT
jgi:hypothetical protein